MDRRDFIKASAASAAAIGLASCTDGHKEGTVKQQTEIEGEMTYRPNTDGSDSVSLLGYGCMRWKMKTLEDGSQVVDQDNVNELVDYAIAHGVNYFDTSPVYLQGQSEQAAATALLRHPRNSYYIATKMSNFSNAGKEASLRMYHRSFEIFQTDHMDYYLLHSVSGEADFKRRFFDNGILDFLLEERRKGRIRNLGLSFHGPVEGFDYLVSLHDKYHWDFVQIQMNYVDWNHATGRNVNASYLYSELDKRGIPVVIMEPLLGGQLGNLPTPVARRLKEMEPSKSVASWAFRFCGTFPRVMTILSGMVYYEHLHDNLMNLSGLKPLTGQELATLEELAVAIRQFPLIPCTSCNYCMPCPYGIDIPGIFNHYNAAVNDGALPESSAQKDFKRLKRKYLTSYDKAIESARQADHCISCRQCISHCPQRIRIPGELARIDNYIEKLKQETL